MQWSVAYYPILVQRCIDKYQISLKEIRWDRNNSIFILSQFFSPSPIDCYPPLVHALLQDCPQNGQILFIA